jgi:hypothetical protein
MRPITAMRRENRRRDESKDTGGAESLEDACGTTR